MTDQLPPPGPTGYQPGDGEGFTSIEVEVTPSWGYQKLAIRGTYVFPSPRSYSEALPAVDEVHYGLMEEATLRLDAMVDLAREKDAALKAAKRPVAAPQAPQAPAPQRAAAPAPAPQGQLQWAEGKKPNDHGTFKYLPSSVLPTDQFLDQAKGQLPGLGLSTEEVRVFDNRTGNYGLESGNASYSPGVVKVNDGTNLAAAMGDRKIVGNIDFNYATGAVEVRLTKDGKQALQAIQIAQQLGGQPVAQQPPSAPHPADDVPF